MHVKRVYHALITCTCFAENKGYYIPKILESYARYQAGHSTLAFKKGGIIEYTDFTDAGFPLMFLLTSIFLVFFTAI